MDRVTAKRPFLYSVGAKFLLCNNFESWCLSGWILLSTWPWEVDLLRPLTCFRPRFNRYRENWFENSVPESVWHIDGGGIAWKTLVKAFITHSTVHFCKGLIIMYWVETSTISKIGVMFLTFSLTFLGPNQILRCHISLGLATSLYFTIPTNSIVLLPKNKLLIARFWYAPVMPWSKFGIKNVSFKKALKF